MFIFLCNSSNHLSGGSCVAMAKVLDYNIIVSEFKLPSCYYIYFWTNTLGKGIEPPYSSCYGLNNTTAIFL